MPRRPSISTRIASSPSGRRTALRAAPTRDTRRQARREPSATYGGLLTITSNAHVLRQRLEPSTRVDPHVRAPRGRARPGWPVRRRAHRRSTSVIHTVVPVERQLGGERQADRTRPGAEVGERTRAPARPRASSIATSATSSVSGRGISTRRSTARSSRRNAQRPSTYCSGSPRGSGRPCASRWATIRSVAGSSRTASNSSPSSAVATSHIQRASCRRSPAPRWSRPTARAPRAVPRSQSSDSASCRARSSAAAHPRRGRGRRRARRQGGRR